MLGIPDHILLRKPTLISKKRLVSARYKKNIDEIIEWLIEVDDYIFSQNIEAIQAESMDSEKLHRIEKHLRGYKEVIDPEVQSIYSKCLMYRPNLDAQELLKFLGLPTASKRGRPTGKTKKTDMLDVGVLYYRRLREILKSEYGIEARDALLDRISKDWLLDKKLLLKHLSRARSRLEKPLF